MTDLMDVSLRMGELLVQAPQHFAQLDCREDYWQRSCAHQQRSDPCPQDGGQQSTDEPDLSGSAVSPFRTEAEAPVAIKAMAAKLARLVYRMLRYGMAYVDQGVEFSRPHTASYRSTISKEKPAS